MRRLSSGWGQACNSTLITGRKQLNSAVSQNHVNTVHTSYSQHCHWNPTPPKKTKTKTSHFKHSLVSEELGWSPPKPNWYTIPSAWLFTLFTNDTEQLLFRMQKNVLFLITAQWNENKQKWNGYIHSLRMLTSTFKILQHGSWLAMTDRESLDYRKRQKTRHMMFPHSSSVHLKVCLWTTYESLLLHIR